MFQSYSFDLEWYMEDCRRKYGTYPQPHRISIYYGGQDIKTTLGNFGSNIIFSNGLRYPLGGAGMLDNISDNMVAITTEQGSHCLDINPVKEDDPSWLTSRGKKKEMEIMSEWIKIAQSANYESTDSSFRIEGRTYFVPCFYLFF
ncbi:hypothetical protein RND81_01G128000 [Saponaria officinalis]|uniref:Uncharacterized protein n=1 Tax=Saponaria officinalis TaxID=3572 RepID=A0AAW1N756_SAPOF